MPVPEVGPLAGSLVSRRAASSGPAGLCTGPALTLLNLKPENSTIGDAGASPMVSLAPSLALMA